MEDFSQVYALAALFIASDNKENSKQTRLSVKTVKTAKSIELVSTRSVNNLH